MRILVLLIFISSLLMPFSVSADNNGIGVELVSIGNSGYFRQDKGAVVDNVDNVMANGYYKEGNSLYAPGEEVIEKRTENSKTTYLGMVGNDTKFSLDVSMGPIHYKDNYNDGSEQWKDIDLTFVDGKITKAPYELTVDGQSIKVRDKKTGSIVALTLSEIGAKSVSKPTLTFSKGLAKASNIALDTDLEIVADNSRVKFTRVLKSSAAPSECKFGLLQTGTGIKVDYKAVDASKEIAVVSSLKDGVLTESVSKVGVSYPLRVDPTLDILVGASKDDAYVTDVGVYNDNNGFLYFGNAVVTTISSGMRFTNVTIPSSAIVSTAYVIFTAYDVQTADTVRTKISAEQNNAALAFSDVTDFNGRTLTTTQVDWDFTTDWSTDVTYNTGEIKTVIEELVTDYSGLSSANIVIFVKDDGSNANAARKPYQWDGSTTKCSQLHIEYVVPVLPTVVTNAATSVEETTATTNGNCTDVGTYSVTKYGTQYGTTAAYGSWSNTTDTKSIPFTFTSSLSSLTKGELYYFRMFATNSIGDGLGTQSTFLTKPDAPSSITVAGINSTTISTTWVKGTGALNTYIRYKDGSYPSSITDGTLSYNGTLLANNQTGLTSGHTYYFRAWSWASEGGLSQYSDGYVSGYALAASPPSITTIAATLVEETTATGNGNVTSLGGGGNVTTKGVNYGTSTGVYPSTASTAVNIGIGTFTQAITSLTPGELYYFRAFGTSTSGTGYGSELTFFTKPNGPSGMAAATLSGTSIQCTWTRGTGADYTVVRYAVGAYPLTTADGTLGYNGTLSTYTQAGLVPGSDYYFRAWSWASEGASSSYSDLTSDAHSVTGEIPDVLTTAAGTITGTTALCGGQITDFGGAAISYYGIQYGTTSGVYTGSVTTGPGAYGLLTFTQPLTGLSSGSIYFFRAFANNTFGYGYGSEMSFLTSISGLESLNATCVTPYCIYQNQIDSTWYHSVPNYVGCVSGCNYTKYGMGLHFTNITIPSGATINSAYLVVTSAGTYTVDTASSIINGEAADNPLAFLSVADLQSRTTTSAYETWMGIEDWTIGRQYVSPDISGVVQEITDRSGWSSGNPLNIFWEDFTPYSSQSCIMPPTVRGGNIITLMITYTPTSAIGVPEILTKDASNVGSASATLNSFIDDDNGDSAMLRFGYDNVTHVGTFAYTTISAWSSSNYSTGESYYLSILGLSPSTTYYFNVQSVNSAGYSTGSEYTFSTSGVITTLAPSSLIVIPESASTNIQWVRPAGYSQSIVRYKIGSIPADDGTGTLLYSGGDSWYTQTGLTPGTTYGYRVWGYEGGVLSESTTGIVTTKGTATSTGLTAPTSPIGWFFNTDYTTQSATFIYPIVNNLADSFHMPRDTAWVTWALALSMFFGFLVWSASRSMMMTAIAVCGGIVLGAAQGLLPKAMILLVLAFAIPIIAIRERI